MDGCDGGIQSRGRRDHSRPLSRPGGAGASAGNRCTSRRVRSTRLLSPDTSVRPLPRPAVDTRGPRTVLPEWVLASPHRQPGPRRPISPGTTAHIHLKEGGTQALPRRRRSPQTSRAPGYRSRATQPARSISSRRRCYLCGLPWGASPSAVATISERRAGKGLRLAEERKHRFQRTVTLAVKFALSKFDLGTFVRCEISE